ncbi:hypothetical protein M9458_029294, partial [Cirrhinus mrigala]
VPSSSSSVWGIFRTLLCTLCHLWCFEESLVNPCGRGTAEGSGLHLRGVDPLSLLVCSSGAGRHGTDVADTKPGQP